MKRSSLETRTAHLRYLLRNEDGAGTIMSLFLCLMVLVLTAAVIDTANAWHARTHLNAAADAAAHAGAVGLAEGMTEADARAFSAQIAAANLPASIFGDVVADDINDIEFVHWNKTTGGLSTSGQTNAVTVKLSRTGANGNALGTHLLQLVGVTDFNVLATAVAVYETSADCDGSDGIYSEEQVTLTSLNNIGSDFCIHSEDAVWLPQQNSFDPGSMVSMPDLDDCKSKCTDSANPGINAQPRNMIMDDVNAWVLNTETSFLAAPGTLDAALKDAWFAQKNLSLATVTGAANLAPLTDIGYPVPVTLSIGDVIPLSSGEFEAMPFLPDGFVYNISCDKNASNIPSVPGSKGKAKGKDDGEDGGTAVSIGTNPKELTFSGTQGLMQDAAVITADCPIDFDDGTDIAGSLVVTTIEQSNAAVSAGSSTLVGDQSQNCVASDRSTVMSLSKVQVPAKFVASNLTLVVDDTVNIASAASDAPVSKGLSIFSSDEVHMSSQHKLSSCGDDNLLAPEVRLIRLVQANVN